MNKIYVSGIVKKYDQKFGFIKTNNKINYFIPLKYIIQVMHGDRITAKVYIKNGKKFIKPKKLIKPYLNIFIGSINKINNTIFIKPHYPFVQELIFCVYNNDKFYNINNGDWFIAKLIQHKLRDNQNFTSKLIQFITLKSDKLAPWKVILSNYNLHNDNFKKKYNKIYFNSNIIRKDLTNLEFISIDHDNTKDIDDAIFLKNYNEYITLIVAISDPTAYIQEGSELDIIASQKLFTNYLPGYNLPMLPRKLSENIFSLRPYLKKPVLACKVKIDCKGNISENIVFFLAWIQSKEKLTYDNVSNWIKKIGCWQPKNDLIKNQITLLHTLCQRRMLWRKKNAVIFKYHPEYKFHFSHHQDITKISIIYRDIAHKMIEEAMIIANISAAKFLSKKIGCGLYNVNLGFHHINIKNIKNILQNNNISIDMSDIDTLIGFGKFMRSLDKLSNNYINHCIIKYQSCTFISLVPQPHFILGVNEYLTWTSPIRKYNDMINHRLLKNIILGHSLQLPNLNIIKNIMHCKHRNRMMRKNIENWLYIQYFTKKNFFNKQFQAKIFHLSSYGIQAYLLINGATIFIPIMSIYNIFREIIFYKKYSAYYCNKKKIYQISDIILVKIVDINVETHKIFAQLI